MHNIGIVSGRFSNRYVVRGFGFRDLNSPDIWQVRITIFYPMVLFTIIPQNADVILAMIATNLVQRCREFGFALPPNVYYVVFAVRWPLSNLDSSIGSCVWDGWENATADDTYGYDYG